MRRFAQVALVGFVALAAVCAPRPLPGPALARVHRTVVLARSSPPSLPPPSVRQEDRRVTATEHHEMERVQGTIEEELTMCRFDPEACMRVADRVRCILEGDDLAEVGRVLRVFAECRDARLRIGILRGVEEAHVYAPSLDWRWVEENCPPGAEGVAARIAIKNGLDPYAGRLWMQRVDDPEVRREVEEAIDGGGEPRRHGDTEDARR